MNGSVEELGEADEKYQNYQPAADLLVEATSKVLPPVSLSKH